MKADNLRTHPSEKGFTLIELMIVIAIIGILAAIAIPNFISYRNKTFCTKAETDAGNVASAIAEYFAIPSHTRIVTFDLPQIFTSTNNTFTISATSPNDNITITVTDVSGRCPPPYQSAQNSVANPKAYWQSGAYYKLISLH